MKKAFPAIALIALLLISAFAAFAQTSNGTIAGVVTDTTGAAIVNAKVTATSTQTGDVRNATSNSVGAYRFESVLPGTYLISATADSFSVTKLTSVQVVASTITSINIQLKPGTSTQTIEVSAQAEMLQTESGEISSTISTAEVQSLPITSLSPYALAATLPGVITGAASNMSNGQNFSVNGNRSRSNNFLIEGQDNNDAALHGQGLQPSNLDAVQEVSIQTNSYGAEFGHGGGSVSNLIYKSGTNNFHGSLWELHSNSALDANDHSYNLNGYSKDKYHENIYGWSFGGPVKKDKLFFFSSMQWDKYRATSSGTTLYAPTDAGVAALQQIASTSNTFQKSQINMLLQAFGNIRGGTAPANHPTDIVLLNDPNTGLARPSVQYGSTIRSGIPNNSDSTELDLKGDYLLTQYDTLNLRYIKTTGNVPYDLYNWSGQLPGFDASQGGAAHNAGITYTHLFSPKVVNELRLSYGRIGFYFNWQPATFANPLVDNGNLPSICISSLTCWGPPDGGPQGRFHNTYQYQDSLSWNTGNHSFKFGADIADIRVADQVPVNWFGNMNYVDTVNPDTGEQTSTGLDNFIDGMSGTGTATKTFGSRFVHAPLMSQNYFVQDTWKLRPNFTLTYGIRYELNAAAANKMAYPAIDPANPFPADYANNPPRVEQKLDTGNWGPRLGFAYTPHFWNGLFGNDKTVIRAGAGVYYDGIFTNILDNNQSGAPNTVPATVAFEVNSETPRGASNYTWAHVSPLLNPVLNPYAGVTSIVSNLKNPRTYQWNLNIQRELAGSFSAQIGYVGTRGTKLYGNNQLNPYDPNWVGYVCGTDYCRLNEERGGVLVRDNSGDSYYHALQAELDRRMTKGLMFRAAYTWSKTIDTGSEVFSTGNYSSYPLVELAPRGLYDHGLSAQDRRQRLALSYVYDVPEIKGFASFKENPVYSFFGKVINGWQLAGTTVFQSGAPGNVFIGSDWNWDGISNDRPMLGNPSAPVDTWGRERNGVLCDGLSYRRTGVCHVIDPSTVRWIVSPIYTQTTTPVARNSFTTPGRQDWTFSITKMIKIGERQKFEWRTEMFNPFNHANTGVPNLTLYTGVTKSPFYNTNSTTANTFGDVGRTIVGARSIRMWLKYSF